MKGSVKLFIASLIVLAAAAGFFAGSICFRPCPFKGPVAMDGKFPPPPPGMKPGMMPPPGFDGKNPPPGFDGKNPPPGFDGPGPKGPHGEFGKSPEGPDMKGPAPEMMDSLLQITADQKVTLDKNRISVEETMKELRKNKFEAEKALGEALDSEDANAIETAKAKVLAADKALLDHRINSINELNKILTKEQREKFRAFHKENMNMFKGHKGHKGPKGPHGHKGPKPEGNAPEAAEGK